MRQQGVNQFDKGLNLDINPIAVDNHTLTGALNATMITMNGNELVLQNDMGNGRVDQAQLPKGYVPVGMQEYGGIVYVASYNPLEGKSQLGCFPSPQRNIPSTEIGQQIKLQSLEDFIDSNGEIKELYKRVPLMGNDDIIRTGDKFVITSSDDLSDFEGNNPLIRLKAIVVDSDGSSIDISNDLTEVRENSNVPFVKSNTSNIEDKDYSIYRNRISGKIYLQEELIIPAYVNVKITAQNQNNTITLIIKPTSYNINGQQWSDNTHGYSFKCNNQIINPNRNGEYVINGLQQNSLVHYELYPTYTYGSKVGKVVSLKREDTININDIGSGEVRFSTFRYYNDMITNSFIFDYSIQAYIEGYEGNNHILNDVYIEAYEANDVIDGNISASNQIKIPLGTLNYFGTYTKMLPYHANTQGDMHYFEAGKHYVGRLHALVDNNTDYTGDWYSIITSTITNKLYLESFDNMIKIQVNPNEQFTQQVFEFDWETEFSRELIDENTTEEMTSDSDINNVLTTPPDSINRRMKYETQKSGFVKYSHLVETKVPKSRTINDLAGGSIKFPYDIMAEPTINYHNDLKASAIINKSGNLADNTIESLTDYSIPNSEVESSTLSNKVWYSESNNELTINYTLYSQLFSKLLKNPANSGDTVNDYKFTIETTMAAFLPYTPIYYSSLGQQQLENILGPLGVIQTNNTFPQLNQQINKIRAEYWFNYCLDTASYDGDIDTTKKNSNKYIGIYDGDYGELEGKPYENPSWIEVFKKMNYSKSSLPNWSSISVETSNKLKERCSMAPFILIWSGTTGEMSALNTQEWYHFNNSIKDYAIPMMQDQSGNYYVLNQWLASSRDLLTEIVNCFNEIYVCQPDQQVTYDYWTGSTNIDDYVYTKNYQLNTSYNVVAAIDNTNCIPTLNDSVYNGYNNRTTNNVLTLDGKSVKLPIIRLAQTTKSVTYTNSFNSPDQSIKNSEFLTTSETPTIGTCAIILDNTGQHIITKAKKIKSNFNVGNLTPISGALLPVGLETSTNASLYTITDTAFNPNHVYIRVEGTGANTYLMDCEDLNNSLSYASSSKGYLIALAIRNRKLKVVSNPEINSKVIVVNPGVCGKITSSNYKLGDCFDPSGSSNDRTARQPIVNIVKNHILDLKIFKSNLTLSNF